MRRQTPSSGSLSLRLRDSCHLTLHVTATRRFIMQKARRHILRCSDRLYADGFRICFNLLVEVLFTFPSRYWYTIGLIRVFSLAGWARQIHTGLLVSRATQDTAMPSLASDTGLSPPMVRLSSRFSSQSKYNHAVLQPRPCIATRPVWALPRSLATTGGIIRLFSLPGGTKMFQFPPFASRHA